MRRRSTRKKIPATGLLKTPFPETPDSPSESPKEFQFNFNATKLTSSPPIMKKNKSSGKSCPPSLKSINTVLDLKELASSGLESIKRQLERSHSEISKDLEASQSRLQKRFKIQTHACQQVMEEAETEYKKMSDRITEGREAMKASYTEFMAEAQSSASRLCKTSIPDISKSFEKAINSLRNRYGISSTSAC